MDVEAANDPAVEQASPEAQSDTEMVQALGPMLIGGTIPLIFVAILFTGLIPGVNWWFILVLPFIASFLAPYWLAWRSKRPLRIKGRWLRGGRKRREVVAAAVAALILLFLNLLWPFVHVQLDRWLGAIWPRW